MEKSRIIFNIPEEIKRSAAVRAKEEDTTLTRVLTRTLFLYGQGVYDSDDFLSQEDLASIARGQADLAAGRVYTHEEVVCELRGA